MTDTQILTIAVATVLNMIAVLIGILINNAHLSEFRSSMEARFNDLDRRLEDR